MFSPVSTAVPHGRTGKLRLLGVSSAQRIASLPEVAAMAETIKGYEYGGWQGLLVPAGTPRDVINKLNAAIGAAIATPDLSARFTGFGVINVANSTPESMGTLMRAEYEKFGKVVKQSGAKLD